MSPERLGLWTWGGLRLCSTRRVADKTVMEGREHTVCAKVRTRPFDQPSVHRQAVRAGQDSLPLQAAYLTPRCRAMATPGLEDKSKDELYTVLQNRLQQLSGAMAGLSSQTSSSAATVQQLQEVGHMFSGM